MQPSQSPVAVGDIVAGKYRVERFLGAGGMGVVVAAQHLQLRQLVAIKFVLPDALGNADSVERFVREARAAVRLRSEHVARVLDVGALHGGAPYMVMEFLEGKDLGALMVSDAPLAIDLVVDCVIQACEALAEAHSLGIVHRDLKPQNLFLTTSLGGALLLKVLDFGVSKMDSFTGTRGLTRTSSMMGSPLYMSPEQMRSARAATARSDIWALGVILYQLLTGRLPFEADSIPELCLKVALEFPPPVRARRAEVPLALDDVVLRCLAKDPAQRFGNAAELASALEPFAPAEAHTCVERAEQIVRGVGATEPGGPALGYATPNKLGYATPNKASSVPPRLSALPLPSREPTPQPWATAHRPKHGARWWGIAGGIVMFGVVVGVAFALIEKPQLLGRREDEQARVGKPAELQSATITLVASRPRAKASASSEAPAAAPTPVFAPMAQPPALAPDAGRFGAARPRGSLPPHDDDIPTMR
jgi:serine/threonine-protein kinase